MEPPGRASFRKHHGTGRNDDETRILLVFESLLDLIFGPLPVTVLCPYDERLVHEKVIDQTNQVHPQIRSEESSPTTLTRTPLRCCSGLRPPPARLRPPPRGCPFRCLELRPAVRRGATPRLKSSRDTVDE